MTLLILAGVGMANAQQIQVLVNDRTVRFDTQPIENYGRVMVPIRGVFELLGAKVTYDDSSQIVIVQRGEDQIKIKVGDDFATKNEQVIYTKSRAIMRRGRVLVPLRFLSEALDAKVAWMGDSRTVRISTDVVIPPPGG